MFFYFGWDVTGGWFGESVVGDVDFRFIVNFSFINLPTAYYAQKVVPGGYKSINLVEDGSSLRLLDEVNLIFLCHFLVYE